MTFIIVIIILTIVFYLFYQRIKKDNGLKSQLLIELDELNRKNPLKKSNIEVKIFEPDTIIALPNKRSIFFFNEGILLFDDNSDALGIKTISVWLYIKPSDEFFIKNCHHRGLIKKCFDYEDKKVLEVMQKSNYMPFLISKAIIKYEILKRGNYNEALMEISLPTNTVGRKHS